ncbi:MAG TPA: peroxiredoxin [Sphingomicrobium sp.]|nr:peroxiredoxin [Sphingomicrobium sp.]
MSLRIGSVAPDFEADTTKGRIHFHQWLGDSWGVLFSHPKDFTPICTTELGYLGKIQPEFAKRNVKVIGLSVDPVEDHHKWLEDVNRVGGCEVDYPIIADHDLNVAKLYDMLPAEEQGTSHGRTPVNNQTVRTVFIIGPDKQIKAMLIYPMSTGRNFDEVLRLIDALQLTSKHKVSTPVNWKPGEDVVIAGAVSDEEARTLHPHGWKNVTPYMRLTRQPGLETSEKTPDEQPA